MIQQHCKFLYILGSPFVSAGSVDRTESACLYSCVFPGSPCCCVSMFYILVSFMVLFTSRLNSVKLGDLLDKFHLDLCHL